MQNIYGQPWESIEKMNHDRETALRYLEGQVQNTHQEILNGKNGIDWERKVGTLLNELAQRNPKYTIIHDVPFHGQNIDHIVIYEDRIAFIVETKASLRLYGEYENRVIHQVTNQWEYLKSRLWIWWIKSFICLTKHKEELHEDNHWVEIVNPSMLQSEIEHHVSEQIRNFNSKHPRNNLTKKVLEMKFPN